MKKLRGGPQEGYGEGYGDGYLEDYGDGRGWLQGWLRWRDRIVIAAFALSSYMENPIKHMKDLKAEDGVKARLTGLSGVRRVNYK